MIINQSESDGPFKGDRFLSSTSSCHAAAIRYLLVSTMIEATLETESTISGFTVL